jgi:hypothetical protein
MYKQRFLEHYPGLILPRAMVGIVLFFNLQCALVYLFSPTLYSTNFELTGIPGVTVIKGMAILFIMWNIPYAFALADPQKNKTSYLQACLMQMVGLIGESIISLSLPEGHMTLHVAIDRFILFDGIGLILLCLGLFCIPRKANY